MKSPSAGIAFETEKKNRYLCARAKRQILLCHPVLYHLLSLDEQGIDLGNWVKHLPAGGVPIDGAGVFSIAQVDYYYRKYLFLAEHGYLGRFDFDKYFSLDLDPESIKQALANVRHVIFEVTDACNLRCRYCGYGSFYSDYDPRRNAKLDLRAAKRLLAYLERLWRSEQNASLHSRITIGFYGGEPLLNFPFIRNIVEYIKKWDHPRHEFVFSMTTNALLLEKHIDFLHENRFELLISLDGNPRNNAYRVFPNGREAYDRIFSNVAAVQKKYPQYFKENINFNAVFHNLSTLSEIYDHFKSNFDKIPTIQALNTTGINPSRREEFWETYANIDENFQGRGNCRPMIDDLFMALPSVSGLSDFIHQYTDGNFENYAEVMATDSDSKRLPTGTCIPFLRKIFLTVNNKILPCERIGHQFSIGRATLDAIEIDPGKIAAVYNRYYRRIAGRCRQCYLAESCGQCMLYLDIQKEDPDCDFFMTRDDRKLQLSSRMTALEASGRTYGRIAKEVVYD